MDMLSTNLVLAYQKIAAPSLDGRVHTGYDWAVSRTAVLVPIICTKGLK